MEQNQEIKLSRVCESTKQDKEAQLYAEPRIWTEAMLKALKEGVKGGKWFSLIDKVYSPKTLRIGFAQVQSNNGAAGVDRIQVEEYGRNLASELAKLSAELKSNHYQPRAVRRVYIPKPGTSERRPLGIPAVRDRVVQAALKSVIEPIFEKDFKECSYGFRPQRGCKDALRAVSEMLEEGYRHVVDADIRSYFDTIDHDKIMELVGRKIADSRILKLIQQFLKQRISEEGKETISKRGTPQGGVISPLLANIYLDVLDTRLTDKNMKLVRYADDLVVLCQTQVEAEAVLKEIEAQMIELKLELNREKTRIVDMTKTGQAFEFLGYEFRSHKSGKITRFPRKKSLLKLRENIRQYTRRCNGCSLEKIIKLLNPIMRGWYEYFKHANESSLTSVDGWVRMRLRSILRKRMKLKGRGRGTDHQRWNNNFFQTVGLFSLVHNRRIDLQSV